MLITSDWCFINKDSYGTPFTNRVYGVSSPNKISIWDDGVPTATDMGMILQPYQVVNWNGSTNGIYVKCINTINSTVSFDPYFTA